MSTMYEMIREAILNKRVVVATYRRHRRLMCPHVLGLNKKGQHQALFYQFGGQSESGLGSPGSPENWRCLPLAGLTNVSVQDGDWHTGWRHGPRQTCVAVIHVEVSY